MPMEGSGMASMATDAPGSAARASRDAWAGYVASARASGQASGQAGGFEGRGKASASSPVHFQESMQQANALHEALGNAQLHVNTLARALQVVMYHKDSPCVVYVRVASCVHTLQRHCFNWPLPVSLCMVTLARSTWPLWPMS